MPAGFRHDAGVSTFAAGLRAPFARYWLSGFLADFGVGVRLMVVVDVTRAALIVALAATAGLGAPMLVGAPPLALAVAALAWRHRKTAGGHA
jgi:hypothetical protein